MQGKLEQSPPSGFPDEAMEAKYISGLSTVLVATVQEAKDRINQIEYVFCSQLYPHFQAKSKTLQKLYAEARETAENEFKERENDLLLQIERLQLEKQQLRDEACLLKLERGEFDKIGLSPDEIRKLQKDLKMKEFIVANWDKEYKIVQEHVDVKDKLLAEKSKELDRCWDECHGLKSELATKTKVVDAGMELQNNLLQMLQSCSLLVVNREEPLSSEEQANVILSRVEFMIKKIDELHEELREKTGEIERGREVQENLLKKLELQAVEVMYCEQQSNECEKEKRLLTTKLESLENDINFLRKEIGKKNDEVEEGRKLQEQLIQQIDLYNVEKIKKRLEFEELKKEKQQLLAELGNSEEKADILQATVKEKSPESSEELEFHGKLLQQIEAKDSQLMFEKQKRRDVIVAYKKLKSQYNFLCSKYGLTTANEVPANKLEDQTDFLRHDQRTFVSVEANKDPDQYAVNCEASKVKSDGEGLENDKGVQFMQRSNSVSPPASRTNVQPKSATNIKSFPPAGTKRRVSYWRDTRSHQSRLGPDLHDDFLDTPLERIRGNMGNTKKDGVQYSEEPAPKDLDFDSSDDGTQEMNVERASERNQIPPPRPGSSDFKYVEPVRKKSARENLKGIECRQCKKFYDAVLPTGCKEADGNEPNQRCEHHDGVSRHRYRYAPPLTPEGFWNIGFESEK